jgi:hypothetical protein
MAFGSSTALRLHFASNADDGTRLIVECVPDESTAAKIIAGVKGIPRKTEGDPPTS